MLFLLVILSSRAGAQALGVAGNFNVFVFNTATTNAGSDTDGAVAVGGNWTGSTEPNGHSHNAKVGPLTDVALYVGGNLILNDPGKLNHGHGYVAGSVSGSANMNNITANSGDVVASIFAAQQAYSQTQSAFLKSFGGIAIDTSPSNNLVADVSGQSGSVKFLTIDGSALGANRTLAIDGLSSTDTLVINVTGNVNQFGLSLNQPSGATINQVLWNMADATNVTVDNRELDGSVLAPYASLYTSKVVNGNVIVNNWTMTGAAEMHDSYHFTGKLPPNPSATPEPGALAFLLTGSGSLAYFGLKRRTRR